MGFLQNCTSVIKTRAIEKSFSGLKNDVASILHEEGMLTGHSLCDGAITQIVTAFIALAIIVAIGLVILASVESAMPAVNESSPYYGLQETVGSTTVSSYTLIVIILIIVAAAGIMYAVRMISGDRS